MADREMANEEAIEILSDMRAEYNLWGDENEATRYHVLSWAIQAMRAEPKHGMWVKMSDADGIYYACSECGNDLPRVIDSFNPQFDLFPKLKCIDKTTYCPSCGARMNER